MTPDPRPDTLTTDPGSATTDPGSATTDPGSATTDPGSATNDPGSATEDPERTDARTRAAVEDPERTDPVVTRPDPEHDNWEWRTGPQPGGSAVVVDMDGVISNASERQHFLRDGRRDWDGFFGACGEDTPIEEVTSLLRLLAPELQLVLLTARPTRVQPQTLDWLARHRLRWDLLVMRPDGDRVPSEVYKRRSVHQLRERDFDLQLAFEDDQRNRQMLIDEGIPCVYIHSGYYER